MAVSKRRRCCGIDMFVLVSSAFVYFIAEGQTLPEKIARVSECYSKPPGIQGTCTSAEMMAVRSVYAGAKPNSTGCMSEFNVVDINRAECCMSDSDNDCTVYYVNKDDVSLTYAYHVSCIGQEVCGPILVQWMPVDSALCSNHTYYPDYTGYMTMEYYCIQNFSVGVLPDVSLSTSSGHALYLMGQQYPDYMAVYEGNCSVEVSCGDRISIQAIHVGFNATSGACHQTITVTDTGGNNRTITCDDNNNYNITEIYMTSSNYVTLHISSQQRTGQFWIGFLSKANGSLTMSCPAAPYNNSECTTVTSTTQVSTSSTSSQDPSPIQTQGFSGASNTETNNTSIIIIIVIVVIVVVLIVVGVALVLRRKYKQKMNMIKDKPTTDDNQDIPDKSSNNGLPIPDAVFILTSAAPGGTAIASRRLPPLTSQSVTEQTDTEKTRKKRKKKKKKKKKKKNRIENDETGLVSEERGQNNDEHFV